MGQKLGYSWVQTISNGRMFSYRKFADQAVQRGLNEVTISMHGHTAELHDQLVGVRGAFAQALAGLDHLVGRIVVNVDVVLNRLNIPYLKDILDFFMARGIHEFDLLHMVPFGRAWEPNREKLFFDPAEAAGHLRDAFEVRKQPGVFLWTNRLPAAYLEGNEDLIQDPHKLHDEVRGRREMFQKWMADGIEPECRGERCPFCPMEGYCRMLEDRVHAAEEQSRDREGASPAGTQQRRSAGREPTGTGGRVLETLEELDSVEVRRILEDPACGCVSLPLERGLLPILESMDPTVRSRIRVHLEPRDYLSESRERDPDVQEILAVASLIGDGIRGLPLCLGGTPLKSGQPRQRTGVPAGEPSGLDPGTDLEELTENFIRHQYRVFSLRCEGCGRRSMCPGLHINLARNIGLGTLDPARGED
jgi:hypothetical protein